MRQARVRQQSFDLALAQREQVADQHAQHAEDHEYLARDGSAPPSAASARERRDQTELGDQPGEERADRRSALARTHPAARRGMARDRPWCRNPPAAARRPRCRPADGCAVDADCVEVERAGGASTSAIPSTASVEPVALWMRYLTAASSDVRSSRKKPTSTYEATAITSNHTHMLNRSVAHASPTPPPARPAARRSIFPRRVCRAGQPERTAPPA